MVSVGGIVSVGSPPASGTTGGGSTSGATKFATGFTSIISGQFVHNLNTRDVVVNVYDTSGPPRAILYDKIVLDTPNMISLLFNRPQSGRIVIIG